MADNSKPKRKPSKNAPPGRMQKNPQQAAAEEVAAIRISERRARAVSMRLTGMHYRDIGNATGVSHEQARKDVQAALEEAAKEQRMKAEQLRQLELERLDDLQSKVAMVLYGKDTTQGMRLSAVDRALRILDARAKLLGIYAPVRLEVSEKTFTEFMKENGGADGGDTRLLPDTE